MESPLREWVEEAVWAAALDQQLAAREVAGVALAAGDALEFALRGWPPDPEVRRARAARFRDLRQRGQEGIREARAEVQALALAAIEAGDLSERKLNAAVMLVGTLFILGAGSATDVRRVAETPGVRKEHRDFTIECLCGTEGFGGEHFVWRRFDELMTPLYREGVQPEPAPPAPATGLERLALHVLQAGEGGVAARRRAMRWLGLPPGDGRVYVAPGGSSPTTPSTKEPGESRPDLAGQGSENGDRVVLSFDDETHHVLAGDAPLKYRNGRRYLRARHKGLRLLHALQYGEPFRDIGCVSVPDMNQALRRAGAGRVQIRLRTGTYELTGPVSFTEGLLAAMGLVRKRRPRLSK